MDIHSKTFTQVIEVIAKRYNLTPEITKNIILSEFECARHYMRKVDAYNNYFPYILMPHLFTIKVHPKKKKYFIEKCKKILQDVYSQSGEA
jgi:hypothetical protein